MQARARERARERESEREQGKEEGRKGGKEVSVSTIPVCHKEKLGWFQDVKPMRIARHG